MNETLTLKAFDDATSIFANKSKVSHWEYLHIAAVYLSIYIVNTAPLLLDPHWKRTGSYEFGAVIVNG